MPHLSKRILEPGIKNDILTSLTDVIKDLDRSADAEKFLSSILSDTERLMIAKRLAAAFLLRHNVESEKIQNVLKLTPATVFRLRLLIQTHQEGFDILFDKMEKERRFEAAKTLLYRFLAYTIRSASGKIPNPFR